MSTSHCGVPSIHFHQLTGSMNAPNPEGYLSDEPRKDPSKTKDESTYARRGPWSPEEDRKLMDIITQCGPSNWVRISVMLGSRSPKQCRERYHQNLKPSLNREPITYEEGLLIEELVAKNGKKWAEIARHLTGRSDNAIKNWWNGGASRRRRVAQVPVSASNHAKSPSPPSTVSTGNYVPSVPRENVPSTEVAPHGFGGYISPPMGLSLGPSNRRPSLHSHEPHPMPQVLENSYIDLKNRSLASGSASGQGFSGQPTLPKIDTLPSVSFKTSMFMSPKNHSMHPSVSGLLQPPQSIPTTGRSYSIDHTSSEVHSALKRRLDEERRHSVTHTTILLPSPAFFPNAGPSSNHANPYLSEYSATPSFHSSTAFPKSGSSTSSSDDYNHGSFTHNNLHNKLDSELPYRRNWPFIPVESHEDYPAKKARSISSAEPTPRTSDGESDTSTEKKTVPAVRVKVSSLIN